MAVFSASATRSESHQITIPYQKPSEGIYQFLSADHFQGEFYYVWSHRVLSGRRQDVLDCYITDPDTAFAFKMRWC